MLPRPKVGETEDDLLKQEEEFLKQSGKAPTQKRNPEVNRDERKSYEVSGIVGDVVERSPGLPCPPDLGSEAKGNGFPALFKIDPKLINKKKGKKSLFALHMEKNKNVSDNVTMGMNASNLTAGEAGPSPGSSTNKGDTLFLSESTDNRSLSYDVKTLIHEENMKKLSGMSRLDIEEAKKNLHKNLDPKLISFLQNLTKLKKKADLNQEPQPEQVVMTVSSNMPEDKTIEETLRNYVGEKWVNMDFLEKEKLEWLGDIPGMEALEPNQPYSARFNFKGELQPYRAEIDVTNSLYHHGEEPERPGYTIQELYQLTRSTVLQQRILALNTLANIIYKSKLGYYDACFDGFLLPTLLEADLFLLLRFSIDEKALIPSAMYCLRRLLYNDSDEYCLDRLLGFTEDDLQPLLFEKFEVEDEEEERELPDNTIIHSDLMRGVMRTDLLIRITYVLNYLPITRETVTNAILCFIRVARHCPESCDLMSRTPGLLEFVYSTINCEAPIYQSVKLFRLLIGQTREAASIIATSFQLTFVATFLNLESKKEISKQELCMLKLESVYLWRNFIRCGYMKDDFSYMTPCFVKLLRFFVERVDIYSDADFDFELFSGLMALLRVCVRERLPINSHYPPMMYTCLDKWMNQLLQSQKFNYSNMKALGSAFGFFIDYFEIFGSDRKSLSFVRKLNGMVTTLLSSPLFDSMATRLTDYSHLLISTPINRNPNNLPTLDSIYENGEDFVRIVNSQSTLPFFFTFTRYLYLSYEIMSESKNNVELFVNHPAIRRYITKVLKLKKKSVDWFDRYEITLLTNILQLLCLVKDKETMLLGFRLVPMIRVDEDELQLIMPILTDKKNWDSNDQLFKFLTEIYLEQLCKPEVRNGFAMRFRNELVGEDWPFKALSVLKGRDAVMQVKKILKFLTLVSSRAPHFFDRIPYTMRYYHLCSVFLTDSNVFDQEIQGEMRCNFRYVLQKREKVDLSRKVGRKKSFYDFYTELITQYAGVSYGMHIFAEFVLFPLQNRFDVSYRKLVWSEYIHVLRVITIPHPADRFMDVEEFIEPHETDESLLVAYLNSISTNVISKQKNPFVYQLAVANINNYMRNACPDSQLYGILSRRIRFTISEKIKKDLMSW